MRVLEPSRRGFSFLARGSSSHCAAPSAAPSFRPSSCTRVILLHQSGSNRVRRDLNFSTHPKFEISCSSDADLLLLLLLQLPAAGGRGGSRQRAPFAASPSSWSPPPPPPRSGASAASPSQHLGNSLLRLCSGRVDFFSYQLLPSLLVPTLISLALLQNNGEGSRRAPPNSGQGFRLGSRQQRRERCGRRPRCGGRRRRRLRGPRPPSAARHPGPAAGVRPEAEAARVAGADALQAPVPDPREGRRAEPVRLGPASRRRGPTAGRRGGGDPAQRDDHAPCASRQGGGGGGGAVGLRGRVHAQHAHQERRQAGAQHWDERVEAAHERWRAQGARVWPGVHPCGEGDADVIWSAHGGEFRGSASFRAPRGPLLLDGQQCAGELHLLHISCRYRGNFTNFREVCS